MTPTSTEEPGGRIHPWGALAALVLLVLIGITLLLGDMIGPRITSFNYSGKLIMPERQQLKFTFSRPMDQKSVEDGFFIDPQAEGQVSWSGRTMVFTPKYIYPDLPYGTGRRDGLHC
ncbi:MAG: hypothetical protein FJY85_18300 [Deltaproteobacteria bacterium]|nr:hypothetical protein [Deltaproteobacteria bacterium]